MKYLNTKTGAVIEAVPEIRGGNWVKVDEQPKSSGTESKKGRKKSGDA